MYNFRYTSESAFLYRIYLGKLNLKIRVAQRFFIGVSLTATLPETFDKADHQIDHRVVGGFMGFASIFVITNFQSLETLKRRF